MPQTFRFVFRMQAIMRHFLARYFSARLFVTHAFTLSQAATEAEAGAGAGAAAPTEAKSDYYKYNFKDFGNIQLCQKQHSKHQLVHPQQLQHSQQQKPAQQ